MLLTVTLVIAAACGLINLWLAVRVSRVRVSGKVMIGDGGDPAMIAKTRAHANLVEYAPFVLILMALIELARGPVLMLWVLGVVFVLARLAHPIGLDRPAPNPLRAGGALGTWLVLLGLSGWALAIAYQAQPTSVEFGNPVETVVPNA